MLSLMDVQKFCYMSPIRSFKPDLYILFFLMWYFFTVIHKNNPISGQQCSNKALLCSTPWMVLHSVILRYGFQFNGNYCKASKYVFSLKINMDCDAIPVNSPTDATLDFMSRIVQKHRRITPPVSVLHIYLKSLMMLWA